MANDEDPMDRLRRELSAIGGRVKGDEPELEYHLTRLSTWLESHMHLAMRTRLYTHSNRAELLAQVDTLLAQFDQARNLAVLAREALLRPKKSEERPGFTD
jgi:hypothetical protein